MRAHLSLGVIFVGLAFYESAYVAMDAKGNLYAGDTGFARVTMMITARK